LKDLSEREVSSVVIGEMVMDKLRALDEVAYVRFASVYRQFTDLNSFISAIDQLKGK
jgi:transcriptional repressor NrdR